jgi:hypothetical protein
MDPHSALCIVINPKTNYSPVASRFRNTVKAVPARHVAVLPHPDHPVSPMGSSPYATLYKLGHPQQHLRSSVEFTPSIVRQLRDTTYQSRKTGGTLHLFGIVDSDSPFGARPMLEKVIRHIKPSGVKVVLHLGVWHPTPNEFARGVNELKTFQDDQFIIGSLFPLANLFEQNATRCVDSILKPENNNRVPFSQLPLEVPIIVNSYLVGENDRFLVAHHSLHGMDALADAILSVTGQPLTTLDYDHPTAGSLQQTLDKNRHIVVITNRPSYAEAYAGSHPDHPYYECLHNDSPKHVVEMLVSPHFGYSKKPYQTVVLLDEPRASEFDWLLSSLVRQNLSAPYYCCFLDPTALRGNTLLTNIALDRTQSLYTQLHDPCRTYATA